MKTSDIFVENLVNKKLLLAAFYHLTYQHDSKDFNICNYKLFCVVQVFSWGEGDDGKLGHGNRRSLDVPRVIEHLRCKRIRGHCVRVLPFCGHHFQRGALHLGPGGVWEAGPWGHQHATKTQAGGGPLGTQIGAGKY